MKKLSDHIRHFALTSENLYLSLPPPPAVSKMHSFAKVYSRLGLKLNFGTKKLVRVHPHGRKIVAQTHTQMSGTFALSVVNFPNGRKGLRGCRTKSISDVRVPAFIVHWLTFRDPTFSLFVPFSTPSFSFGLFIRVQKLDFLNRKTVLAILASRRRARELYLLFNQI